MARKEESHYGIPTLKKISWVALKYYFISKLLMQFSPRLTCANSSQALGFMIASLSSAVLVDLHYSGDPNTGPQKLETFENKNLLLNTFVSLVGTNRLYTEG